MEKKSVWRMLLTVVLALVLLIAAQLLAVLAGEGLVEVGLPGALGNAAASLLYPLLTVLGIGWLCRAVLRLPPEECGLPHPVLKAKWVAAAFALPAVVMGALLLMPGEWVCGTEDPKEMANTVVCALLFFGLGTGIAEEAVFRGAIMTALERRWGRTAAVIVPSVLFGLMHIIGNSLSFGSAVQLAIAGTAVGVMFSLIALESGGIWCAALVHGVWNAAVIGGMINIGAAVDPQAIWNYVLKSKSFLITGGDFGVEASVIAIAAYLLVAVLAWRGIQKKQKA